MPLSLESPIKGMMNVGVTANLVAPLSHFSAGLQSSSTETDETALHNKYKKFINEKTSTQSDETYDTLDSLDTKRLYHLKAMDELGTQKITPTKIEFLLYRKARNTRRLNQRLTRSMRPKKSHSSIKRLIESESKSEEPQKTSRKQQSPSHHETSFVGKLKKSLGNISKKRKLNDSMSSNKKQKRPRDSRIDIYPFDHGCAEYLRTTDSAPHIISEILAQRATDYSTKFWAEVFGSLHIGVTFILTFFLQAYRFLLYSLVKSIVVGFLQMTSDYGLKPLLTVLFNGFIQPLLIFVHNILSSIRDFLKPVAETMDNFLKPVGNVLRCIRLVTVNESRVKKLAKDV